MQDQDLAGAADTELAELRQQQADSTAEFEDLLSCLGQETAKVGPFPSMLSTISPKMLLAWQLHMTLNPFRACYLLFH